MTQERLRELFEYRADGWLIKKVARRGNVVGAPLGSRSAKYVNVMVDGTRYLAHRLIFLFHHGYLPPQVDHANGDGFDNRIENLRAANASQNAFNRKVPSNSPLGVKNITRDERTGRYAVRLAVEGRNRRFGTYGTMEEAVAAATEARKRHCGAFANHG